MVVSLTTGVMHYVTHQWFATEPAASTKDLLLRSTDLIHRIMNDGSEPKRGMTPQP